MSYRKLTSIEREELKIHHRGKGDRRICDKIKAVLLYDNGYKRNRDIRNISFE